MNNEYYVQNTKNDHLAIEDEEYIKQHFHFSKQKIS